MTNRLGEIIRLGTADHGKGVHPFQCASTVCRACSLPLCQISTGLAPHTQTAVSVS